LTWIERIELPNQTRSITDIALGPNCMSSLRRRRRSPGPPADPVRTAAAIADQVGRWEMTKVLRDCAYFVSNWAMNREKSPMAFNGYGGPEATRCFACQSEASFLANLWQGRGTN
jgi:hypothetical protein